MAPMYASKIATCAAALALAAAAARCCAVWPSFNPQRRVCDADGPILELGGTAGIGMPGRTRSRSGSCSAQMASSGPCIRRIQYLPLTRTAPGNPLHDGADGAASTQWHLAHVVRPPESAAVRQHVFRDWHRAVRWSGWRRSSGSRINRLASLLRPHFSVNTHCDISTRHTGILN